MIHIRELIKPHAIILHPEQTLSATQSINDSSEMSGNRLQMENKWICGRQAHVLVDTVACVLKAQCPHNTR